MKSFVSIKLLSLLGFLLLMAPFYDSCNGKGFTKVTDAEAEAAVDSTIFVQSTIDETDTISEAQSSLVVLEDKSKFEKVYDLIDDESNTNGFEFAKCAFDISKEVLKTDFQTNFNDLKKSSITDKFSVLITFLFLFIVIISFTIFCISFSQKIKWITKLSFLNITFSIITLNYILFFDELFEEITQIKWGYYAFITVQVLIFYYSRKMLKSKSIYD